MEVIVKYVFIYEFIEKLYSEGDLRRGVCLFNNKDKVMRDY